MQIKDRTGIQFDCVDVDFELKDAISTSAWLLDLTHAEGYKIELIQYIYCSDLYLLKINQEYLNHDTYTDIITFPYSSDPLRSDIFISIDRVKENAKAYKVTIDHELHRVMAHGLLHLCGYGDKTDDEQKIMTSKENTYLSMLDLNEKD